MSDVLTPLRRAYGVEAPGDTRAAMAPGPAVEAALLSQGRTALDATVAAQDRCPSEAVLAAVLAEASRASVLSLAPLAAVRALYNRLPAQSAPVGADVSAVEAAILAQTRVAVEQTVDGRTLSPSAATLASVSAYAASATRLAPRPDAPVEATDLWPLAIAYGLPTTFVSDAAPVEIRLLVQTRALLDGAPAEHVSEASVAAVVARAAAASRLAPAPDAAVASPALAALAVAYGLPLAASAGTPSAAETQLLVQSRGLLDAAPSVGGPSGATLAAVVARASEAPGLPDTRPAADRPLAARPAADREPVRAARSSRRIGAWSGAAVAALALVVFFFPRPAVAPELPGAPVPVSTAALAGGAASPSTSAPSLEGPQPDAGALVASAAPTAPTPPSVSAPSAVAAETAPVATPAPRASGAAPAAPTRSASQPAPSAPRAAVSRDAVTPVVSSEPAVTLASTVAPDDRLQVGDEAWEAQGDLRVLSLRLQELRRGNAGLAWDTPTEAFGAPTTRSAFSAPGIQSVRQTVPAARARLLTVPGDR